MTQIGDIEGKTQRRVVALFCSELGYDYLGDLSDGDNRNIMEGQLAHFLWGYQGFSERDDAAELMRRAIAEVVKVASNTSLSLYDRNKAVYALLRYGVKVKPEAGAVTETVWLIDWKHPERNRFAIAEEVAVKAADPKAHGKRPDIVIYVNGIALGVLELKRSTVSVAEGIRQNLDNQKKEFIQPFFSTVQYVMAGSDAEGLRYGTIQTPEKYYLTWKEDGPGDKALRQICAKARFLELIHDFVVFDAGTKKLSRHNQYFGVKAAQAFIRRREGGILWHTQGSGKSLIMVWLAKWIRENVTDSRVLIITDRTELDEQIEKVFLGVAETIARTKSGADLAAQLNLPKPWLLCSLIHKFGGKEGGEAGTDARQFVEALRKALPKDWKPKGDLYVFVDECHRTQSGELNIAMKGLLPNAVFIGFTGTPLLKDDKKKSFEIFGGYIHTYKFDEAVKDGVVLDLRYEARDIEHGITSQSRVDKWFDANTTGLTPRRQGPSGRVPGRVVGFGSSKPRRIDSLGHVHHRTYENGGLARMAKLTLSVDDDVVARAKAYAAAHQTSISGLVTEYLRLVTTDPQEETPPVLKRMRGLLRDATVDENAWRQHLDAKYGR